MAFTMHGVGVPGDVFSSPTNKLVPRQLTHANPEWNALSVPLLINTVLYGGRRACIPARGRGGSRPQRHADSESII